MRFIQRFVANAVAVFVALYLVDSVAGGRFVLRGVWAALILALLLGFANSLVRPLHRARSKPVHAALVTVVTIFANALILQALAWAEALSVSSIGWVTLAALFVTLVTGTINWLIGFGTGPEKPRAASRQTGRGGSLRPRPRRPSRPRRAG